MAMESPEVASCDCSACGSIEAIRVGSGGWESADEVVSNGVGVPDSSMRGDLSSTLRSLIFLKCYF